MILGLLHNNSKKLLKLLYLKTITRIQALVGAIFLPLSQGRLADLPEAVLVLSQGKYSVKDVPCC